MKFSFSCFWADIHWAPAYDWPQDAGRKSSGVQQLCDWTVGQADGARAAASGSARGKQIRFY